jgi:hypothetical protein
MVDKGPAPPTPRREPVAEHGDNGIEPVTREVAIGPCLPEQVIEILFGPFPRPDLGYDMLCQDIQRILGYHQPVEFTASCAIE